MTRQWKTAGIAITKTRNPLLEWRAKVKEIQAGQMIKSTMIGSHLKLIETKQKKNIRLKLLGIESKSERAPKTKTV